MPNTNRSFKDRFYSTLIGLCILTAIYCVVAENLARLSH